MTKILLDSDVVINILKKKEETLKRLHTLDGCLFYLSPIVIAEVYAGARSNEMQTVKIQIAFEGYGALAEEVLSIRDTVISILTL